MKVGDLLKTEWGYVEVVNIDQPKFVCCILLQGKNMGKRIYLRGYDLTRVEVISESG